MLKLGLVLLAVLTLVGLGSAAEVYVYPDSWSDWGNGCALISGGLSDVQTDNDAYMVVRCNTSDPKYCTSFSWDTPYTPAQVTKITVEYQAHCTRSDTPNLQGTITKVAGGSTTIRASAPWPTTDTWHTWETASVSTHMTAAGVVQVTWCGCPNGGNLYNIYTDVMRLKLEVVGPPVTGFSGTPTSGTAPLAVTFTDSSTNTPTSWSWNFGDSNTSTAQNPSHTYAAGTYTVSLRATNAQGYDDEVKTSYITATVPAPVAAFSGTPTSGTAPLAVTFTDSSTNTPTSWSWNFGDGSTSTSQNPSHSFAAGTYTVSLRATNAGGYDDEVKTNYIAVTPPAPVAAFSGTPTSGTAPLSVSFTDSSTNIPTSWSWNFGDSTTSTSQNPSHSFAAGTYTVSLRATNAGGYDDEVKTNYITATSGGASTPTFVAAGTVASGTGTITPALPSGIASDDILLLFVETANQAVSITNQNGGTWAAVTNSPQGTGTAGGTSATRLTAFWSRYNGNQGAPTVSDSGNHQAGRIIAVRGCATSGDPWDVTAGGVESTADTSGSILGATTTVANTLVVTAIATSLPDASGTANFSAWTNADLTSLTERTDNTVTAGNGGGLGTATGAKATAGAIGSTAVTCASSAVKGMMSIALKPTGGVSAPVAAFSGTPTSGTAPLAVAFTDASTNTPTSWSWNFGDSTTSTSQNPSHTFAAGTFTVSLRATNAGGYDDEVKTNYITATVAPPVAAFSGTPTSGMAPLSVTFTDASTNTPTSWSWNFGDSTTSTSQNPSHSFAAGAYTVSLRATNAGGFDDEVKTNYITATVPPQPPVANFSGTPTNGSAPLAVTFTDLSTGTPTSWSWNFGDSTTATTQNPSHTYTSNGNYTVSLTATNAAGSDGETKSNYIVVGASSVYVYPDEWGHWDNGATLQSGGLANLQADDSSYMVFASDTSNQTFCAYFNCHTSYQPMQVAQLTYEWQFKGNRANTPAYALGVYQPSWDSWYIAREMALWPTTDTTFTWSSTEISTYMSEAGLLAMEIIGCPQNTTNYTTSIDLMRIKLDFNTAAPAAPTNLATTVMNRIQVKLTWTDNATNEYKFRIQRKTGAGGTWGEIGQANTNATSYYDNTVAAGTTYYYRVCAYNSIGDSAWTAQAEAIVPPYGPPEAPSGCEAHAKSASQIDVTWYDNAHDPLCAEDGFVIEYRLGSSGNFSYLATVDREYTRYSHTGLTNGQEYQYRVYAQNGYGNSAYSNTASTTAHALTVVTVSSSSALQTAIDAASPGTIIEITDGTYIVQDDGFLLVNKNDLTIRSQSGNRSNVVIKGNGINGYPEFCFKLYGSNHITFENMTLKDVYWHIFQLNNNDTNTSGSNNCVFRNLYMWDAGEGPMKTTYTLQSGPWSDNGLMEDCVLGYTNGSTRGSIEAVDLIGSANWVFRRVEVYACYGDPYHTNDVGWGIFAKSNSLDTVIEDSYFEDCGIAMSFGGSGSPSYYKRFYVPQEHTGGIMRNNVVRRTSRSIPIHEVGIYTDKAVGYRIYNNTLWTTCDAGNSIDIRFAESWGWLYNNIANQALNLREGGQAYDSHNLWSQAGNESTLFVDQPNGNLHLKSTATTAINQGLDTTAWVKYDMDGETRPKGAAVDIGADEY